MLVAIPLGLTLATACATALAASTWEGPAAFEVKVEDPKGHDIAGAEIVVAYVGEEGGSGPRPALTDKNGRAVIAGLAAGQWSLEVRKPGFMSFRAELTVAPDHKPEIQSASQHNVPGAVAPMRVRFGRAKSVPFTPQIEPWEPTPPARPAAPAPAPAPAPPAAPVAPPAAPMAPAAATPSPAVVERSPPKEEAPSAPAVAAAPAVPAAPVRPVSPPAVVAAPAVPAAPVAPAAVTPSPAVVAPPKPAVVPPAPPAAPPAPVAPAVPVVPAAPVASPPPVVAPAPAAPLPAPRPVARQCVECRPGETAAYAQQEVPVAAPASAASASVCPADLASRLASAPPATWPTLQNGLPPNCALLFVALAPDARFVGFRYEAQNGPSSQDCLPGKECPIGDGSWPFPPVIRHDGGRTVLIAAFENRSPRLRRVATMTAYWVARRSTP
jgi:hypothetical protein